MAAPPLYDVVFLSTGLVECVAAAALAAVGKKVLQIDANDQYGSSWSTVASDRLGAPVVAWRLSAAAIRTGGGRDDLLRRIQFDLNPRLAYADGPLISLLLSSGAHNYTEFVFCQMVVWCDDESVGESVSEDANGSRAEKRNRGRFVRVAASKGDVFKDASLSLAQKNSLMRALKELSRRPDRSWREVSSGLGLDAGLVDRFVHGVCLSNGEDEVDRKAGALLTMYGRSLGKYAAIGPNASSSPFLYPKYGAGELCSAFARRAAVSGAVQMLRCEARVVPRTETSGESTVSGAESGSSPAFDISLRDEDGTERRVSAAVVVDNGGSCREPRLHTEIERAPGHDGVARTVRDARTMARCAALVRGRAIREEGCCLAAFPRASLSGRVVWMLQLDGSSGCCDLEGYTIVQLWTTTGVPGEHGVAPQAIDEFRGILESHFDCSLVTFSQGGHDGGRRGGNDGGRHGAGDREASGGNDPCCPQIEVLWSWHAAPNVDGGGDVEGDGIISAYDGDLVRDGLASYAGLAEEAERVFRLACGDVEVQFPFGKGPGAAVAEDDEREDAELDELADLLA